MLELPFRSIDPDALHLLRRAGATIVVRFPDDAEVDAGTIRCRGGATFRAHRGVLYPEVSAHQPVTVDTVAEDLDLGPFKTE